MLLLHLLATCAHPLPPEPQLLESLSGNIGFAAGLDSMCTLSSATFSASWLSTVLNVLSPSIVLSRSRGFHRWCFGSLELASLTSLWKSQAEDNGKIKDRVLNTANRMVKEVEEEVHAKGHPESAADEVPAKDEGGRCVRTSQSTAKRKAASVGQACCRSVGIVIIWL